MLLRTDGGLTSVRASMRIADNYTAVMPLIREAIDRNVHAVLGYASPGAYVKDRFGDALGKLGVELRREVVKELSRAGLSTRAIAPVVGVTRQMVSKDLRTPQVATELPPAPIVVPDLFTDVSVGEVFEAGDAAHGSPEATAWISSRMMRRMICSMVLSIRLVSRLRFDVRQIFDRARCRQT